MSSEFKRVGTGCERVGRATRLTMALLAGWIGPEARTQGTVYSPAPLATSAGNALYVSPLAPPVGLFWQQLHDGIPVMTIRRLTFRRSAIDPTRALTPSISTEIQL